MEQMRKLPIGIQTFEKLREENYLYVDKTAMVYKIASNSTPYFLSRPRRFGKSLLISTFEAYFQGRKDLFHGLAIEKLETRWEEYPVLHLDLNARKYETAGDLVAMLNQYLEKWELKYGAEKQERSPEERFAYVIEQAYAQTGKQVVVLIDIGIIGRNAHVNFRGIRGRIRVNRIILQCSVNFPDRFATATFHDFCANGFR